MSGLARLCQVVRLGQVMRGYGSLSQVKAGKIKFG
jgi:hypothetical protein